MDACSLLNLRKYGYVLSVKFMQLSCVQAYLGYFFNFNSVLLIVCTIFHSFESQMDANIVHRNLIPTINYIDALYPTLNNGRQRTANTIVGR